MTEQQKKAKELIDKYKKLIDDNDLHCALGSEIDFAILCVDEILKEIYSNNLITNDKRRIFYQEVRKEIIN